LRIDVISAVPKLLESPFNESIVKRAKAAGVVDIHVHDLRPYGIGKYRQIDDDPFGGGAGMVLKPEPIFAIVDELKKDREYDDVIFLSPDGKTFDQPTANELSLKQNLIFICGHYKGVDERVREALVTREISLGDFVLTGGELPAAVIIDAIVRLLPGAIHDTESALLDSFQTGLLEGPIYTRPAEFDGMKVPDILLSGDHKKVAEWKLEQSLKRTRERRPDLLPPGTEENYLKTPKKKKRAQ
jgi:tRNA (guanine37-N1)-methyltransferase